MEDLFLQSCNDDLAYIFAYMIEHRGRYGATLCGHRKCRPQRQVHAANKRRRMKYICSDKKTKMYSPVLSASPFSKQISVTLHPMIYVAISILMDATFANLGNLLA